MCPDGFVYDIEIEDNNNYLANNILVHNCSAYPKPSKRTIDLLKLTKNKPVVFLSGTPTPESYSQIYQQLWVSSFSPFAKWPTFYKWAKDFVNVTKKKVNGFDINDYSDANKELIDKHISHLFLTQTQEQAGFDVSIEEEVLTVPLNVAQIWAIDKLIKDRVINTKEGYVILGDTAVKLQTKIHQLSSGTIKTETGEIITISEEKALFIQNYFKGRKIAIYYKFIGEFEVLKKVFPNWTVSPEDFQDSSDKVFLGQFISAREGIRLDTADAIVFYNIDFSYLSYDQAKERIISKERTQKAKLYWIFSEGGIEQKIFKAVKNKQDYTNHYFKADYGVKRAKKTD